MTAGDPRPAGEACTCRACSAGHPMECEYEAERSIRDRLARPATSGGATGGEREAIEEARRIVAAVPPITVEQAQSAALDYADTALDETWTVLRRIAAGEPDPARIAADLLEAHGHEDIPAQAAAARDVIAEVVAERARQDAKSGQQTHPDGTGPDVVWAFTGPASFVAKCAQVTTDRLAALAHVSWRDIALEELAEAFAEDDPTKLRTELVQLAAVCVQWVQAIDRRASAGQA